MKRLRLAADQRKVILGHAEERGRFTAGRLFAVKAVTDGDKSGIGIELEFDCTACALSRVLLCHMVSFLSTGEAPQQDRAVGDQNFITALPTTSPALSRSKLAAAPNPHRRPSPHPLS